MRAHEPYTSLKRRILDLAERDGDRAGTANETMLVATELDDPSLEPADQIELLFICSSLVLNCGFELADRTVIAQGQGLAERALKGTTPDEPLHHQCRYNLANAVNALAEFDLPETGTPEQWQPLLIRSRIDQREQLRHARREFSEIASSGVADPRTRSAAYCNLANMLDYSGRWAEAYDYYLNSLEADPTNGNAAGNLAQLLLTRIRTGTGQTGHIAAVYDKYLAMAQSMREGTLEFASQSAADRWERLESSGSQGHLSHGLDDQSVSDREYRLWVADRRLALSPAVEGLGTDDVRWDSATIETLYSKTAEEVTPPILGAMNVLKSDYLVSRRLAFEGESQILEGLDQAADDSGSYVETLDHSLYGTQYSKLLLAQRSALDVLDKTAVVANEHFDVGDVPSKVGFRSFWTTGAGELRDKLVQGPTRSLPNLALAELAADMAELGMYSASQALRNAGTHRIVHAALVEATGVTRLSRSRVDLLELVDSTTLALQVTRSAFLYLIDLVAVWNHPDDHPGHYVPIPALNYFHDPVIDGELDDIANDSADGEVNTGTPPIEDRE